uniref:G-protein coupled receptors family 1 profile domain-containing protein n=1 Tax=Plectus sambesii TaxID=2011161 RepID=A0A914XBZ9_9BILA
MLIWFTAPGAAFATCAIAYNRMTAIVYWNKYKTMWTEARLNALIAIQWIICIVYVLPMVRMDFMIGTRPTETMIIWFTHGENGRAYFNSVAIMLSIVFIFLIIVSLATVIGLRIKNNRIIYAASDTEAMRDQEQSRRKIELRITFL